MIGELHEIMDHLEQLPEEEQEEILVHIEVLLEVLERRAQARGRLRQTTPALSQTEQWVDPVGAWSDLPITILDDLDRMRHEVPPTPPIEDL